ncbi:MAG: hypothetical protein V3S83_04425 [Gemmatimonadota bacterium]
MKLSCKALSGGATATLLASVAASVALGLSSPLAQESEAAVLSQEPGGRFKVLVVPVESSVLDKKFGEKVAKEIMAQIDEMPTHSAIEKREFERALKRYEVKKEDLNAIRARQLANLMGAQVSYYGTIVRVGAGFELQSSFVDVQTGDEVVVPAVPVADKSDDSRDMVTAAVMAAFEEQIKFLRARAFCADYVGSQQPDNALRNCNEALAINAHSVPALFNKALAFRQMFETETEGTNGWADSAVTYFTLVLDDQPGHKDALQNAAYIYSRNGEADKASELYEQYLQLDPTNVPVRLKVAYDLAQAELMPEAIAIIQEGLEYAPDDLDLLQSLGDYALRHSQVDSSYVDIALPAYEKVLELKGEETDLVIIENSLAAYTRSGRSAEAAAFAERALRAHAGSQRLWSLYADALGRLERFGDATQAMDRVLEIDDSYTNGYLKRGQFKLRNGDEAGAIADFDMAIESGSSTQSDVFSLFWSEAHTARGDGQLSEAVKNFERAAKHADASQAQEVQFWWAYSYFQLGERIAKTESASVRQLGAAKNYFAAAQTHFVQAGNVKKEVPQLKEATSKWLLNVEARIKRAQQQ